MVYFNYFNPSEIKQCKSKGKTKKKKGGIRMTLKTCNICLLDIGQKEKWLFYCELQLKNF